VGTEDITAKPWQMDDTTDMLDSDEEVERLHGCQVRSISRNISVQTRGSYSR